MNPVLGNIMSTENYQTYDRRTKDFASFERNRIEQIRLHKDLKYATKKENYLNAQSVLIQKIPIEEVNTKRIDKLKQEIIQQDPNKFRNLNGIQLINPITQQFLNNQNNQQSYQQQPVQPITCIFQSKKRDFGINQHWTTSNQQQELMQAKKKVDEIANMQMESNKQQSLFQTKNRDSLKFGQENLNGQDRKFMDRKKQVDEYYNYIKQNQLQDRSLFQTKKNNIESYQNYLSKSFDEKDKLFQTKSRLTTNQGQSKDFPLLHLNLENQQPYKERIFQSLKRDKHQVAEESSKQIQMFQQKNRALQGIIKDVKNQTSEEYNLMQTKARINFEKDIASQNDSLYQLMQSKKRDLNSFINFRDGKQEERPLFQNKKRTDEIIQLQNQKQETTQIFQKKIRQPQDNFYI